MGYESNFLVDVSAAYANHELAGYTAINLFNGFSTGNLWINYPGSSPSIAGCTIPTAKIPARYAVQKCFTYNYPTEWKFQGSNSASWSWVDGDWTDLDSQTGQSFTTSEIKYYNITNSVAYKHFRIRVTAATKISDFGVWALQAYELSPIVVTAGTLQTITSLSGTPHELWITAPVFNMTAVLFGTPRLNQLFTVSALPFSVTTELSGTPGLIITVDPPALSVISSLSCGNISVFPNTSDYIITYICRVTPAFGADVLTLPMSSFQGRFKSGDPSYLSVVIPGLDYAQDIVNLLVSFNRENYLVVASGGTVSEGNSSCVPVVADSGVSYPELAVYIVKTFSDGNQITEQLMAVNLEKIDTYEGATNQSMTLDGHRTKTYTPKIVTLTGASYRNTLDGKLRYRCAPDLYLRPGDTVVINEETFTADDIVVAISPDQETFEFAQGIASGGSMNPILLASG